MRKLLNTLYVTTPESYVLLDGENVVIKQDNVEKFRIPFVNIENIVCFNYMGCSPALMGKCSERNVSLNFMSPSGRFLGKVIGETKGNVLLRRQQYRDADDESFCISISKNFISAKIHNSRYVLGRVVRDHKDKIDFLKVNNVMDSFKESIQKINDADSIDKIRGIEGECAKLYFGIFDEMIVKQKDHFSLKFRTKRPPLDNVNAMLSYMYTILTFEIQSALETVGLDPYVGFMHTDRAGRASLALDVIEELRAYMVDRLVLSMINLVQIKPDDFLQKEGGAVLMKDECRKKILKCWQDKKNEIIEHPFIGEKIQIGLIPYVQVQLLARYIRGDIEDYPPFLCKF